MVDGDFVSLFLYEIDYNGIFPIAIKCISVGSLHFGHIAINIESLIK